MEAEGTRPADAQHKDEIARSRRSSNGSCRKCRIGRRESWRSVRDDSVKRFQKKLANVKAQADREIGREKEKIQTNAPVEPLHAGAPEPLRTGPRRRRQTVRVLSLGVTGTVTSVKGDEAEVLVGNIKLRRPVEDLEVD